MPVIGPVVGIMEPDAMAAEAAAQAAAGFTAIKIKVGETVARDIDRVAAVRAAIGETMALRVDANDHYVPADAIRLTRAIERYRPEHMEQPVARHDILGLAEVRRNVGDSGDDRRHGGHCRGRDERDSPRPPPTGSRSR